MQHICFDVLADRCHDVQQRNEQKHRHNAVIRNARDLPIDEKVVNHLQEQIPQIIAEKVAQQAIHGQYNLIWYNKS